MGSFAIVACTRSGVAPWNCSAMPVLQGPPDSAVASRPPSVVTPPEPPPPFPLAPALPPLLPPCPPLPAEPAVPIEPAVPPEPAVPIALLPPVPPLPVLGLPPVPPAPADDVVVVEGFCCGVESSAEQAGMTTCG